MNASRFIRFRFSLLTLFIVVSCAGVIAAWIARAERQRQAVLALRALDEHEAAFHSFYGKGNCAPVVGPRYEPCWLYRAIGLDFFYDVTLVFVHAERLDEAIPHLARLPGLHEVYVSTDRDDDSDQGRAAAAARINAAIMRLKRKFPHVKIEENPGCPILVSKTLIVG